ncbi:MAG: hypothetical protein R6V50_05020 [Thermoplasmatota archaeon]
MMNEEVFFCKICGVQLCSIDEITLHICHKCKTGNEQTTDNPDFFCWACGKKLSDISQIAQGICHGCKASIHKQLKKKPQPSP